MAINNRNGTASPIPEHRPATCPSDIPADRLTWGVPLIPTRPNRGPKGDPLECDGFLMGNHKPHPPGALPEAFKLVVRDGAMEPLLSKGEFAIFSTLEQPTLGDCVLVGTTFGPDIRQYQPISDTEWAGFALNPEYENILSVEEPIWVVAVLVGISQPDDSESSLSSKQQKRGTA